MKTTGMILSLFAFLLLPLSFANALPIPINLNDFYADPTVAIAPDGSSATMYEDSFFITVLLSNDPFFGDPGIPVPSNLVSLNFDYSFMEGVGNDDDFYAKVFNGDTGDILADFLVEDSLSGTVSWSLSGIDPAITLLGLEFQLNAYDLLTDSVAQVSNVSLDAAAAPIPEPTTAALLGSGLLMLLGFRKRF